MKKEETKKKRGAPKGNQNARKHGFYSKVLDEKEQAAYNQAVFVEGIDEEISEWFGENIVIRCWTCAVIQSLTPTGAPTPS